MQTSLRIVKPTSLSPPPGPLNATEKNSIETEIWIEKLEMNSWIF